MPTVTPTPIEDAAALIRSINDASFSATLCQIISHATSYDNIVIFAYNGEKAPIDLFHGSTDHPSVLSLGEYQSGAYLLDPFYHACKNNIDSGVHRLKDLAPDHFFRSEYYRSYYSKTNIIDEMGTFIHMPFGGMTVVSIAREAGSATFRKKEIERVTALEPIVREAVIQHWRNPEITELSARPSDDRYDTLPSRVQHATKNSETNPLTNREAEVVSLILRGYSSIAIGTLLEISASTVKVHRKNIYAKLHISSQAELFSMFLPLLTRPNP